MKKYLLVLISLLIFPLSVKAAGLNATLSCPEVANASADVSCTMKVKSTNGDLKGLSVDFSVTSGTFKSFSVASGWTQLSTISAQSSRLQLNTPTSNEVTVGTLKAKMPSSGSATVKATGISGTNPSYVNLSASDITKTIRVTSSDNTLSSLTASGATFTFNKNTTTYNLTINAASTTISATASDSHAKISGTGNKTLKYGKNTFSIVVTAESGAKKTYTLNITRPDNRNSDNNLATLKVTPGSLSFNKNTTSYNVSVDSNVTKIKVDATLSNSKSSFVKGYGPREVSLNYGTNKIQIKVKAENETQKVYTINVTRKDNRSSNNNLKSLTVSSGEITFSKNVTKYQVIVENNITELTVKAAAEDSKAKVSYTEKNTLKVGTNTIKIKVTAENNSTKEYVLTVTRKEEGQKLDNNNALKSLTVEGYNIVFSKDVPSYSLTIKDETSLKITALPEGEKAIVNIIGNENLKNGSIITISVTAEDGTKKDYSIKINKQESQTPTSVKPTEESTKKGSDDNLPIYIGVGIGALLLLLIIIVALKKKKQQD